MDYRNIIFENYVRFKAWDQTEAHPDADEIFFLETKNIKLNSSAKIFEVGFGQGDFLKWSKAQGHSVGGTELIPELVERALNLNIDARLGAVQDLDSHISSNPQDSNKFDLIAAFDLLEHLYPEELIQFFKYVTYALKPGGYFIARFPNGQSPFGRIYQQGDFTHVTTLSGPKIEQLGSTVGLKIFSIQNAARPLGKTLKSKVLRTILYFLRDFIGKSLSLIFWGQIIPMDPNLTVILKKN